MMLFITHAIPKTLKIDEIIHLTKTGAPSLRVVEKTAAPATDGNPKVAPHAGETHP